MAIKKQETEIQIRPVEIEKVQITIVGDSPLIVHAWSEKAKRQILDTQMKVTKTKAREAKNPIDDFINSMYWLSGKPVESTQEAFEQAVADGATWGFPANSIKQAAVSGAFRAGAAKDKVSLRGAFFINGVDDREFATIEGSAPEIREDMVRVGNGAADVRYRGEFKNWRMPITISYNKNGPLTLEQIVNIVNLGGYVVGIGEWRPEKDGDHGMFHVSGDY